MEKENISRFTYRTEKSRLDNLKIQAVKTSMPINKLLDKIIDEYLKNN